MLILMIMLQNVTRDIWEEPSPRPQPYGTQSHTTRVATLAWLVSIGEGDS